MTQPKTNDKTIHTIQQAIQRIQDKKNTRMALQKTKGN
jgi:hypothetical protein